MKRVLLIAYDFPPRGGSGVFRAAKFARYLPEWGWQPVVVTVEGEGPHPDQRLLAELPADIEVHRVSSLGRRQHKDVPHVTAGTGMPTSKGWRARLKPLLVPDAQLGWVPGAFWVTRQRLRRGDIDAVMTSGPPFSTHLVGWLVKRRYPALPWVMDMRDLWSEGFDQHLLLPYKLNRWIEQHCVQRVDRVTVVTDSMGQLMVAALGAQPEKVMTITNGFDRQDVEPYLTEQRSTTVPGALRPLRLCYVGTITEAQGNGIASLFAAFEQLRAEGTSTADIQLQLVGAFGPSIHARARSLTQAGIVTFLPFQPHREAIACMMNADALLLVRPDDLDGRIVHTSKVFEYMAVGRPILAIAPLGEITRLVASEQLGRSVAPHDVVGIVTALRQMITEHRNGTLAAPPPALDRWRRWERRELTGQLARLLDRLAASASVDTTKGGTYMRVLDLGCGRAKTVGAIGIDRNRDSDADIIHDLNDLPYPFLDDTFDRIICSGIIEHVDDVVRVMEELHRVCRPNGIVEITTPYFSSVDAWTDPTHKHYFSSRSFDYFTGEFPEYSFYSRARFRKQRVDIQFWSLPRLFNIRPQHWLGAKLLADHALMIYERFFAFMLPAQRIYFELVVLK